MQQTRKHNRPKQFHAAVSWRWVGRCAKTPMMPRTDSKDQRCGRETHHLRFPPRLLPSNVCYSQWELTALPRLIWQLHLFLFHYPTPVMLKASLKANSKSESDIALTGWQLKFSYKRTTVGCLSTHTHVQTGGKSCLVKAFSKQMLKHAWVGGLCGYQTQRNVGAHTHTDTFYLSIPLEQKYLQKAVH